MEVGYKMKMFLGYVLYIYARMDRLDCTDSCIDSGAGICLDKGLVAV